MGDRINQRTKHPGIYQVLGGKSKRYMVSFRVSGLGQRTRTFPTLTEAKVFQGSVRSPERRRQIRELEQGRVSLADYFSKWLDRRRNITPSTRLRYEGVGANYILPTRLGRLWLSSITRGDVEDWPTDLQRNKVPAPTIDKAYRTLRACLETAAIEGKAIANPAKRIRTPDLEDREPFFLTADQVDSIANAVSDRDRALVYFLAYTGARIGEASALRLRHLDLPRAFVTIKENSPEVGGRKIESAKTKTKAVRSLRLPDRWSLSSLNTLNTSHHGCPKAISILKGMSFRLVEVGRFAKTTGGRGRSSQLVAEWALPVSAAMARSRHPAYPRRACDVTPQVALRPVLP